MNAEVIEEILSCPSLPSLPAVAARVIELAGNEEVSLDELASTIQTDQALASKVLRTVNSSYYGLRSRCGSIRKAISMLGLSPIKSLSLGFSLVSSLQEIEGDGFDFDAYWRRALFAAAGARHFAEAMRIETSDEVFLGALMQDVGMVASWVTLADRYSALLAKTDGDHSKLAKFELESLEMTHGDIGAMLCERWRLPQSLVIPVRYHERPTAAPQEFSKATRCLALGTMLYEAMDGEDRATKLRRLYTKAKEWINLNASEVDEIGAKVASELKELSDLFQLDAGEPIDGEAILVEAAQRMMELETSGEARPDLEFDGVASLLLDERFTSPRTLTLNARGFQEALTRSIEAAKSGESEVTLLIAGLDRYADLNDQVGAEGVAKIQLGACTLLRKHFEAFGGRPGDLGMCRCGVLLFSVAREASLKAAECFRADLERVAMTWFDAESTQPIAVSVGAVNYSAEELAALSSPGEMVSAAATAMAASQAAGGNSVRVHVGAAA